MDTAAVAQQWVGSELLKGKKEGDGCEESVWWKRGM
jgi:hypothetical protein